ncbi:MAG TPA: SIMPL domain-containing protein [Pyrinomonadaceae bacterium]|nr:SIMPL domain-containing protein [Pyrinomonadaceae bacterium]
MRRLLTICGVLTLLTFFAAPIIAGPSAVEIDKTVRGRLQRTVEAGGWLVVENNQKFLLLNAQRFQNESWFKESVEVEAVGETKDVMTIYMEGTPFEAQSLKPLATQGGNQIVAGADRRVTRVTVSGDSLVQAQPDTAILTVSVVTQAKNALDAQQQNAARTDAVVRTLKSAAGAGAEVKTSGYSLQPQRIYRENQPPTITGYEARNTVTVTIGDLTKVGPVIDAAAQSGANDIGGVAFTLRKDRPARDEALALATREAMSKAQVIAQALGGRVVRIVEVQEEGTVRPRPIYDAEMVRGMVQQKSVATPIEIGSLEITGRVQVVAEVEN